MMTQMYGQNDVMYLRCLACGPDAWTIRARSRFAANGVSADSTTSMFGILAIHVLTRLLSMPI